MTTDAPPPTGPTDVLTTRHSLIGPGRTAQDAAGPADAAAAGDGSELPSLVIITGRHQGRRIPVPATGIVLGREGSLASFFREDPLVSHRHAQVYVAADRSVRVADLNSTNGTFVNGEAIRSSTRLDAQDMLRIGSVGMRLDPPAAAAGGGHEAGMTLSELLDRVRSMRAEVDKYLAVNFRRRRLLVNLVVIAGASAALLTAPPAVGGKPFTEWLQGVFPSLAPSSWRFLCLLACLASLVSVVAIQIQKSNNYEERIVRAQGLRAALEVLEFSITCGSLTIHKATSQFLKCLEDSSFMEPAR
jgi:Inner membrane component of T3SS, cytoplasmic domain